MAKSSRRSETPASTSAAEPVLERVSVAVEPSLLKEFDRLLAARKLGNRSEAMRDLMSCFDLSLPPDTHLQHVRRAFFADGHDPAVWKGGWHPATATMQSAAVRSSDHAAWKLGGGQPMLIVQALQDVIAPPPNARALLDAAPDRMTLAEIDNAGHAMLPEQPDAIAKAVIDWLNT